MLRLALLVAALSVGGNAHAQAASQCCDNAAVSRVITRMLKLHHALVHDDGMPASQLHAMVREVRDDPSLPKADRDALHAIKDAAEKWKDGEPSDIRDHAFAEMSRNAIFLALRHEGGKLVVHEATCPGKGSWLQADSEQIQSPWPDCGTSP